MKDHNMLAEYLIKYMERGCKGNRNIGLELEHFVLYRESREAVPFYGTGGVEEILKKYVLCYPDSIPEFSQGWLIGFSTADFAVSVEPAAQIEISMRPCESIMEIERIYHRFREPLERILSKYGYLLLTEGTQPVSHVKELALTPKARYQILGKHYRTFGDGGIRMFNGSASTQISIDYRSEEDWRRKLQAALLLTPVFQIITDNSTTFEGERVHPLMRDDFWRTVDPVRCGLPPEIFGSSFGFENYADYICKMPMCVRLVEGKLTETALLSAEEMYVGENVTDEDIELMLSIVFPDVRPKQILEIRCADSLPEAKMLGYSALIKGLLYSDDILDKCQNFICEHSITEAEYRMSQQSLKEKGIAGEIYGIPAEWLAVQVREAAGDGLTLDELHYLDIFRGVQNRDPDQPCKVAGIHHGEKINLHQ